MLTSFVSAHASGFLLSSSHRPRAHVLFCDRASARVVFSCVAMDGMGSFLMHCVRRYVCMYVHDFWEKKHKSCVSDRVLRIQCIRSTAFKCVCVCVYAYVYECVHVRYNIHPSFQ